MNLRALTVVLALVAPLSFVACNGEVDPGSRSRGDNASADDPQGNGATGGASSASDGSGTGGSSCDPNDPSKPLDPGDPNDPGSYGGGDPGGYPGDPNDPGKDPGTGEPNDPGFACVWNVIDDGGVCLDPTNIKDRIFAACAELGGWPNEVEFSGDCPDGGTSAKFSCCVDPTGAPGGDPGGDPGQWPQDPNGDPSTTACSYDLLDGQGQCLPVGSTIDFLVNLCASRGEYLSEVSFSEDCADGGTFAKYSCCVDLAGGPSDPNDPGKPDPGTDPNDPGGYDPTADCSWSVVDGQGACLDVGQTISALIEVCAAQGAALSNIEPSGDCPEGGTMLKFSCCSASAGNVEGSP
ncbi:MAG: hypothetical protein U0165_03655 [Polyangiaceae bacterium]